LYPLGSELNFGRLFQHWPHIDVGNTTMTLLYFYLCRNYFGNINFFGGPSTVAIKSSEKLRAIEEEDERGLFAILSDVCLDSPKVNFVMFSFYATKTF
jgi:hypothetical protein